ncbi:MAG: prepilin-type N-terminal cleavage/methylation domain-containing protein [Azonexaceae bacterium]|nr:prepilin-type N-terminal cleavage/methylation domain-containing protein [Azonexaceae bacterium]
MKSRGFSLVELMVVIAIMAVLLGLVSPSLMDWMVNLRIRNATDALLNGLQQARQEAVRRNQNVSFWLVTNAAGDTSSLDNTCTLSGSSGSWVVSVRSPAGGCGSAPSTTTAPMIVSTHPIGDGVRGVSIAAVQADGSTSANRVEFNGVGSVVNTADHIARIDVESSSSSTRYRSLRVEITGIGAFRMCDPAVASTDARACKL